MTVNRYINNVKTTQKEFEKKKINSEFLAVQLIKNTRKNTKEQDRNIKN